MVVGSIELREGNAPPRRFRTRAFYSSHSVATVEDDSFRLSLATASPPPARATRLVTFDAFNHRVTFPAPTLLSMRAALFLSLTALTPGAFAHGDAHDEANGEATYAEMHMASEVSPPCNPPLPPPPS